MSQRAVFALLLALLAPQAAAQHADDTPPSNADTPQLTIRGFGDVDFRHLDEDTDESGFSLGQLDLFVTSALSDRLSVLAEIVFEPRDNEGEVVDVERYEIRWAFSDRLKLGMGRMHSVLGYWNQTFHHGRWFQTTAFRPEAYLFEDEPNGGILPVHEVGVQLFGTQAASPLQIDYEASLTNGRGPRRTDVQTLHDRNRGKAVNIWLGLSPRSNTRLRFGGVLRFDTIPVDGSDPARVGELSEHIAGAFLTYQKDHAELLAEVHRIAHEDAETGRRYVTHDFYTQAQYSFGRTRPYYRYDDVRVAAGDPFYATNYSLRRHTAGVRVDPSPWAALKAEASRDKRSGLPSFNSAAFQLAFTF